MYGFREKLIEQLEYKLKGCEKYLKLVYRQDMLKMFCDIEKEIQIQKSYLQIEA